MSWDVDITHETLPDPQESIMAFASSKGSILRIIYDQFGISPKEWTSEFAITSFKWLIKNIDLGNDGIFNDDWCVDADMQWSKGRESHESYDDLASFIPDTYEQWTGKLKRDDMRKTAIRFLLYYIAGYTVKFEW